MDDIDISGVGDKYKAPTGPVSGDSLALGDGLMRVGVDIYHANPEIGRERTNTMNNILWIHSYTVSSIL